MTTPQGPTGWHWDGSRWWQWDGTAWQPQPGPPPAVTAAPPPVPSAPPPTAAAPPPTAAAPPPVPSAPPGAGASPPSGGRRSRTIAIIAVVVVVLAAAVAAGAVWAGRRGSDTAAPTGQTIVTVPINTAVDPFSPPMGEDLAITPVTLPSPTTVPGGTVGLYGGTKDNSSCDRAKLARFLADNPDKASAWADVLKIQVTEISTYLERATPLLLRSDTLVVNHGFRDGKATPFTSVLQAGSAVLADTRGQPVVRCYCGNPLAAAPQRVENATYTGPTWTGWNPNSVAVITMAPAPVVDFVVVDVEDGSAFTRPPGTDGGDDGPAPDVSPSPGATGSPSQSASPSGSPSESPSQSSGTRPAGQEEEVFAINSIAGVSNRPTAPSVFTIEEGLYVTSIMTYHYNNGGTPPGTIALKSADGTVYGPWQAVGTPGQGGVANAYWTVTPDVAIPPGTYTIVDSNPATWSWAPDTGGRGITIVKGIYTAVKGS